MTSVYGSRLPLLKMRTSGTDIDLLVT